MAVEVWKEKETKGRDTRTETYTWRKTEKKETGHEHERRKKGK